MTREYNQEGGCLRAAFAAHQRRSGLVEVAIMLLLWQPVWGEVPMGAVNGIVRTEGGRLLAGVNVHLECLATGENFHAITDDQGKFRFGRLRTGGYQVVAWRLDDRSRVSERLEVKPSEPTTVELRLLAGSLQTRQGVPETRAAAQSASSTDLIQEEQIVGLPLNGRSYTQLVALRAGISDPSSVSAARGAGGGNLTIAGFLFAASRPNLRIGHSNNPVKGVTAGCAGLEAGQELGGPGRYFDACAFEVPAAGTLGKVGRNTIRGPGIFSVDLSLQREFALSRERRLQFRAEFFNLPHRPSFSSPTGGSSIVFTGESGRRNSRAGRITRTATTARQIQFALRLNF